MALFHSFVMRTLYSSERKYLQGDISAKLEEMNFPNNIWKEVIIGVFGRESQEIFGLIECNSEEDFRSCFPWFNSKQDWLEGGLKFSKYFETHIAANIASLNEIRGAAGPGE